MDPLDQTTHRPWPLPDRPWFMAQTWRHLLFAHWRVEPAWLRGVVPPQLPLDVIDGSAWVAVTPFQVDGFRVRFTPPLPGVHSFPEVNVRTYVTIDGRPGIFFFSLDADNRLAVASARRLYRLPYFRCRAQLTAGQAGARWTSERVSGDGPPAQLRVAYRALGAPAQPRPGTLEHSLSERYCLYTLDGAGRVLRGDIHHPPWRLSPAAAEIECNTMGREVDLALDEPPLLHVAAPQHVVFWRLAYP
jgi:uncharacterized protein YqjF (DUF2071 family)